MSLSSSLFAQNFSKSKKELRKIYTSGKLEMVAFYSNCKFKAQGKKLVPIHSTCGYEVRKQEKRAARIEWEHVMPAYDIGRQLPCWREGGRKNCSKNLKFRAAEADMLNLVPAIGEINGDRSNFKFGMIEGEKRVYGDVDFEIDFKAKRAEPPNYVKGNISRIYFYMRDNYKIKLSKQQTRLFEAWNRLDPVDEQEKIRNRLIFSIQGNFNPYVEKLSYVQPTESESKKEISSSKFQCGSKKYCKDMSSCAEARFYLNECGKSRLDRDKDGTPCESLCR